MNRRGHLPPTAVVLGTQLPVSLGVIRSLGRLGVRIVAVDRRAGIGMHSKYVRQRLLIPHDVLGNLSDEAFLPSRRWPTDWLIKELNSLGLPAGSLIIPTSDESTYFAARNHEALSEQLTVACAPWSQIEPLWDKRSSFELARKLGIGVPEFYAPSSNHELEDVVANLDFQKRSWMLRVEVWSSEPMSAAGNLTCPAGRNTAAVLDQCHDVWRRSGKPPLIIEVVPGPSECCIAASVVIAPDGTPVVRYSTRRIEVYPYVEVAPDAPYYPGGNVFCETYHDQEALDAACALLRQTGYYGAATFEFRRHVQDNRLILIKFDPRLINRIALSTAIGQDEAVAICEVFAGDEPHPAPTYVQGAVWLWLGAFLYGVRKRRRRQSIHRQVASLIRRVLNIKAFGDASFRDPKPFLVMMWRGLKQFRHAFQ